MTIYSIQPLVAFILNISLILLILINNRNKNITLAYIFWNLSMAVWNLGFFLLYNTSEYLLAVKYNHILISGTIFIFSTTFHFVYNVANIKTKLNKTLLYLAYFFSFLFLLLHFKCNILSNELKKYFWGYYPLVNIGDLIYSVVFSFYITYAQVLIFKLIKISSGQKRQQYKYIFWGTFLGALGGVTNFLPTFGIEFYPFGNLTSLFYTIAIAYAFIRIKMVNLQYLLRKILEYLAILSSTVILNIIIVFILLPSSHFHRTFFLPTLACITFVTFIFLKVFSGKIRTFINAKFYAKNIDFVKSIQLLTSKIRSILDENQLVEYLLKEIPQIFLVEKGSIRIFGKTGAIIEGEFECKDSNKKSYTMKETKSNQSVFLNCFEGKEEIIIRDELQKKIEIGRVLTDSEMKIFDGMNAGDYAVMIAVNKNGGIKGCILLGNKFSGDMFYKDELNGLNLLKDSLEAAISNIQNVLLIKEQQKKIEIEFVKSQKVESIGVFAGGIAHDFNNMLTSILGNISLAKRHLQNPGELGELLADAEKASLQAKELTKQLSSFARGGESIKKVLSISKILNDTVKYLTRNSKVKFDTIISDNLWSVEFDEGQMIQVINNLIINAVESMPEGGVVQINAENIDIKGDLLIKDGEYVKIAIKDEGVGIAKENITKIFDPYWTTKSRGSGLGLATVYSIIRRHEGHIDVESETGKGATFYVYILAFKNKT
ncbi:MAG: ATP-binding protein [Candidatus Firestonebacteria bacterium]